MYNRPTAASSLFVQVASCKCKCKCKPPPPPPPPNPNGQGGLVFFKKNHYDYEC